MPTYPRLPDNAAELFVLSERTDVVILLHAGSSLPLAVCKFDEGRLMITSQREDWTRYQRSFLEAAVLLGLFSTAEFDERDRPLIDKLLNDARSEEESR